MLLSTPDTHLYPGSVVQSDDAGAPDPTTPHLLVFSDGSTAAVQLLQDGQGWVLASGAHETAAGTAIAAKRWRLALPADTPAPPARFKLGRRLPGP